MKKIILPFLVGLLFFQFVLEDTFYITFVKGTIIVERTQKAIKVGDKLSPKDKLIFKDPTATASAISPTKGRFTLSATKATKNAKGEFMAVMENALAPLNTAKRLSTRAGLLTAMPEVQKFFAAEDSLSEGRFMIIGQGQYRISSSAFPMNDKQFFFIRYNYNGQTVNKKLAYKSDTLLIDTTLYLIDGKAIKKEAAQDMKLYYYTLNKEGKPESQLVTAINPVFASEKMLISELKVLVDNLKIIYPNSKDFEKINDEVLSHLNYFYGKPDPEKVSEMMKKVKTK